MKHRIFRAMIVFYRYRNGGYMSKPTVLLKCMTFPVITQAYNLSATFDSLPPSCSCERQCKLQIWINVPFLRDST